MTTLTVGHAHGARSSCHLRPRRGARGPWARTLSSSNKYGVRDAVRYGTADLRADSAFGRLAAAGRTVHVLACAVGHGDGARWARAGGEGGHDRRNTKS